jgi:superfamily I DNA/RNA helicase
VHLARHHPDWRVLLTTFSDPLAHALRANVRRLLANEPRVAERLDVHALPTLAAKMYEGRVAALRVATSGDVSTALRDAAAETGVEAPPVFLRSEWDHVVDAWQIESWEAYRDVARLGRRTRLSESRRAELWRVFAEARERLALRNLVTESALFHRLAALEQSRTPPVFDAVVVDESQDLSIAQLRFLAAIAAGRPNALFCAGDLGQRIFQQPFSWKALGVDIRGRSKTLRVNYRTSQQIREHADRLLDRDVSDADGNSDQRTHTVSIFNGPVPDIAVFGDQAEEQRALGAWMTSAITQGLAPHEMAIFVRSPRQLDRATAACAAAGLSHSVLDTRLLVTVGSVSIGTMHLAKGLEYKAVAVMACDDEIIPLQSRIEAVGDDGDLEETYESERNLLYVACTRARDALWVSGVAPESEFLADLKS